MTRTSYIIMAVLFFFALEAALMLFIDRPLSEYLRAVDTQHHDLINFFRGYTDLGLGKWYEWPSALGASICALLVRLPAVKKKTREATARIGENFLLLFLCVAISGLITDAIKYFVGRARPVLLDREGFYGFHPIMHGNNWHSWPSGHATTGFALAFLMTALFPRGRLWWFLFALAIAVSRVMVNAHFLSDVIAGAVVGSLTVYGIRWLFNHNGIDHIKHCIFPRLYT